MSGLVSVTAFGCIVGQAAFCRQPVDALSRVPLLDRIDAAREAGFEAVELLFPYDDPVPQLRRALNAAGLPLVLINAPPPNWTGGPRGFAAVPGGEARFRHDFTRSLRYAGVLEPRILHVMAGAAEGDSARRVFVESLAWAAEQAPPGLTLTIEPINAIDMPGNFLNDFDQAAAILDAVGAPNLALQFSFFTHSKGSA